MSDVEVNPDHQLSVMTDEMGHRLGEKIFEIYMVGEKAKKKGTADYKRKPEFLLALDRLVSAYGGKPIPNDGQEPTVDADGNADRGYEDDEDVNTASSESEVASLKRVISRFLG
jgi:hypothetical protein